MWITKLENRYAKQDDHCQERGLGNLKWDIHEKEGCGNSEPEHLMETKHTWKDT